MRRILNPRSRARYAPEKRLHRALREHGEAVVNSISDRDGRGRRAAVDSLSEMEAAQRETLAAAEIAPVTNCLLCPATIDLDADEHTVLIIHASYTVKPDGVDWQYYSPHIGVKNRVDNDRVIVDLYEDDAVTLALCKDCAPAFHARRQEQEVPDVD